MVRADEIGQLDVRTQMSEEIGAEGDENRRATIGVPGGVDERVDERTPLLLGD